MSIDESRQQLPELATAGPKGVEIDSVSGTVTIWFPNTDLVNVRSIHEAAAALETLRFVHSAMPVFDPTHAPHIVMEMIGDANDGWLLSQDEVALLQYIGAPRLLRLTTSVEVLTYAGVHIATKLRLAPKTGQGALVGIDLGTLRDFSKIRAVSSHGRNVQIVFEPSVLLGDLTSLYPRLEEALGGVVIEPHPADEDDIERDVLRGMTGDAMLAQILRLLGTDVIPLRDIDAALAERRATEAAEAEANAEQKPPTPNEQSPV